MKEWRTIRKELNDCRLDYYEAQVGDVGKVYPVKKV